MPGFEGIYDCLNHKQSLFLIQQFCNFFLLPAAIGLKPQQRDLIQFQYMILQRISRSLHGIFFVIFISVHFNRQHRLFTNSIIDKEVQMCCRIHNITAFLFRDVLSSVFVNFSTKISKTMQSQPVL